MITADSLLRYQSNQRLSQTRARRRTPRQCYGQCNRAYWRSRQFDAFGSSAPRRDGERCSLGLVGWGLGLVGSRALHHCSTISHSLRWLSAGRSDRRNVRRCETGALERSVFIAGFRGFNSVDCDPFLLSEGGGENDAKILRLPGRAPRERRNQHVRSAVLPGSHVWPDAKRGHGSVCYAWMKTFDGTKSVDERVALALAAAA